MSVVRVYEYARLWVPLYDAAALAVTRPVYLIEAADGFEGIAAEKNTTLMGLFNELGRAGWRIDATLDEADHATSPGDLASAVGTGGDPAGAVAEYDVYPMRRRADR